MQVGDLVKHNGSGPVGWKMKGYIGMITKRKKHVHDGAAWCVRWVSSSVSDWDQSVHYYSSELEVISESR
jgi:hypothetical protein